MEDSLLLKMVERMSIAATLAFLLSQTPLLQRLNYRSVTIFDKAKLAVIFGLIGIVGTYAGIPVDDALANSRVIGVMAAGLIGGPVMGAAAGLIAGGHRYFLFGGFSAFSCALANLVEGLFAGMVRKWYPHAALPWWVVLLSGVVGEVLQMAIILLTARPFDMALTLVEHIALPMIVANSIGLTIFMAIIRMTMDVQQQAGAAQSQKALAIAAETLAYFRKGLDEASAQAAADIIYATGSYHAVAVTNATEVLAFVGDGAEHHRARRHELTKATVRVLQSGEIFVARTREEIGCPCGICRLESAIVAPLKRGEQVIGSFKLYYTNSKLLNQSDVVFAKGLAQLFSIQLELAEIDRQAKLVARAELKALQAQINPHFLFNTLNTITSLIRTKPDQARELLQKLGSIFRFALQKAGHAITLEEELAQVRAYLAIEKARYEEKLCIEENIDERLGACLIPSLIIQPIVENAVIHGLKPKVDGGTIWLDVQQRSSDVVVVIRDDGVGMDLQACHPLEQNSAAHIGMQNVHERLQGQYGGSYGLTVQSAPGEGTVVTLVLPCKTRSEEEHAQQHCCG